MPGGCKEGEGHVRQVVRHSWSKKQESRCVGDGDQTVEDFAVLELEEWKVKELVRRQKR